MNEALLFVEIVIVFSLILAFEKFLGLAGLYSWIGIAAIIANLETAKSVEMFGISAVLGNVMFASVFLATDIISERYGKREAQKGVYIGLFSVITFLICSQIALLYLPSVFDIAHTPMVELFQLTPRICIASVIMFFVANLADVYLYNKLKEKFNGKKMWLRNNISTILCNCGENFGMFFIAFYGIYPISEVIAMALSTSVIEIIIAVCDTPFLYISRKVKEIGRI